MVFILSFYRSFSFYRLFGRRLESSASTILRLCFFYSDSVVRARPNRFPRSISLRSSEFQEQAFDEQLFDGMELGEIYSKKID